MKDALDILIGDRAYPDAKKPLVFHHANLDFLPPTQQLAGHYRTTDITGLVCTLKQLSERRQ
jgi:hypothetical protein